MVSAYVLGGLGDVGDGNWCCGFGGDVEVLLRFGLGYEREMTSRALIHCTKRSTTGFNVRLDNHPGAYCFSPYPQFKIEEKIKLKLEKKEEPRVPIFKISHEMISADGTLVRS